MQAWLASQARVARLSQTTSSWWPSEVPTSTRTLGIQSGKWSLACFW